MRQGREIGVRFPISRTETREREREKRAEYRKEGGRWRVERGVSRGTQLEGRDSTGISVDGGSTSRNDDDDDDDDDDVAKVRRVKKMAVERSARFARF